MRPLATGSVGSDSIGYSKKEHVFFVENIIGGSKEKEEAEDFTDFSGEASFGDNNLGFEGRERSIVCKRAFQRIQLPFGMLNLYKQKSSLSSPQQLIIVCEITGYVGFRIPMSSAILEHR